MKLPTPVKNFFSYFNFLIADRQLRHFKQIFKYKEQTYQSQIQQKEQLIDELRAKILCLEIKNKTEKSEVKKRFEQINFLQEKLTKAKQDNLETRQKLSALYMTNNKLVNFLEQQAHKQPATNATISHYH